MSSPATSTTKKSVSFDNKVKVQKFSSRKVKAEKKVRWFSRDDFSKMRYDNLKTVHIMEHNPQMIAQHEKESNKYCTRGLFTTKAKTAARQRKYKAINAVLENCEDWTPEQIALHYSAMSMSCVQIARQDALQDEQDVKQMTVTAPAPSTKTTTSPSSKPNMSSTSNKKSHVEKLSLSESVGCRKSQVISVAA